MRCWKDLRLCGCDNITLESFYIIIFGRLEKVLILNDLRYHSLPTQLNGMIYPFLTFCHMLAWANIAPGKLWTRDRGASPNSQWSDIQYVEGWQGGKNPKPIRMQCARGKPGAMHTAQYLWNTYLSTEKQTNMNSMITNRKKSFCSVKE